MSESNEIKSFVENREIYFIDLYLQLMTKLESCENLSTAEKERVIFYAELTIKHLKDVYSPEKTIILH